MVNEGADLNGDQSCTASAERPAQWGLGGAVAGLALANAAAAGACLAVPALAPVALGAMGIACAAVAALQLVNRSRNPKSRLIEAVEQGAEAFVLDVSADLRIVCATPRTARLLGLQKPYESLALLAPWAGFAALAAERPASLSCDVTFTVDGEARTARVSATANTRADGVFSGYRIVGRDITAEQRALAELAGVKLRADQFNGAQSQFLSAMSHELRTPLNAIQGFTDLLLSPQAEDFSPDVRAQHLTTIAEAGQQLSWLVNDLLDLTRIERHSLVIAEQEADAAELTEVAVKMCRQAADGGDITIIARVVEGVEVRGDILRLKQILVSLITLAVKLSSPGGYVYAGFERGSDGGLAFTVRDSGFGVQPDELAAFFEPFAAGERGTARRFGGMGLGLTIARKLARLHGGDVTLESEIGAGTTARLILPANRVTWALGAVASVA